MHLNTSVCLRFIYAELAIFFHLFTWLLISKFRNRSLYIFYHIISDNYFLSVIYTTGSDLLSEHLFVGFELHFTP